MNKENDNEKSFLLTCRRIYKEKRAVRIVIDVFFVALAFVIGMTIGGVFNKAPDLDEGKTKIAGYVAKYAEEQDYSEITENPSIATPGFTEIEFKANQLEQEVTLYNPEENTCYFKISIILKDGTKIWTSDLLEPGMSYKSITLNQKLKTGTYNDVGVKYECYSLKDLKKLNGSVMKTTLKVK